MALYPVPQPRKHLALLGPRIATAFPVVIVALAGLCMGGSGRLASTSITMVNYATPVKAAGVVQSGFLGGKVSLTGTVRASSSLPGSTLISRIDTVTPASASSRAYSTELKSIIPGGISAASSRAQGLELKGILPGGVSCETASAYGDLQAGIDTFDLGSSVALASGVLQPGTLKNVQAAAPAMASSRIPGAFFVNQQAAAPSAASGAVQPATLKSLHFAAPSIGTAREPGAFLEGKVSLDSTSRAAALLTGRIANTIQGGISRAEGRLRSTGIIMVGSATPSRAVPRAQAIQLRFVGAGFDMGSGLSRILAGRARATSITWVYYATPIRTGHRLWAPITLWYDAVPVRGFGFARVTETLYMQGQQPPTICRSTGGRALSVNIKVHSAVGPSLASSRATAVLQFANPAVTSVTGSIRSTAKAHATQLKVTSGLVQPLGTAHIRISDRLSGQLITYYTCTPIKADPRISGWLHTHQEVAPVRHAGRVIPATLAVTNKQFLNGRLRVSSRAVSALKSTVNPTGISAAGSRLLTAQEPSHALVLLATPSREVGVIHCSPLAFTPPNFVEIGTGIAQAHGSLPGATLQHTHAAAPIVATSRVSAAALSSLMPVTGTVMASGMVTSDLTFQGAFVLPLDGQVMAAGIVSSGDIHQTLAGGRCLMAGRVIGAEPSFAVALGNNIHAHPRAWGVLAFTGAVTQPISGQSTSAGPVATAQLSTMLGFATSQAYPIVTGMVTVFQPLAGAVQAHPLLLGFFENPYRAVSLCGCTVAASVLTFTLPLDGATRGTSSLSGQLTIPRELPQLIFQAKVRAFVFLAKHRVFVFAARERAYIFEAGGDET